MALQAGIEGALHVDDREDQRRRQPVMAAQADDGAAEPPAHPPGELVAPAPFHHEGNRGAGGLHPSLLALDLVLLRLGEARRC